MKQSGASIILSPMERRFRRVEGIMRKSHEHVILLRSVNGPIDQTLIEAIAGGSQVAMRTLYDRHSTRVYRFILRIVGNATRAEDLAQEVFLRIYRARHGYEPTARFSTWLFRIANNLASNVRRDTGRKREVVFNANDSGPLGPRPGERHSKAPFPYARGDAGGPSPPRPCPPTPARRR
jgi:hypothetical protein